MSIISRRQRELLLNDVSRMINNNIHSAFANHAKVAESISNGDLKLYIDSPKKELVLKYGNNNIRFTISEQTINEIASIVFKDKSIIKGISDSLLKSSSNIALSTKGANELKQQIDNKAAKDHNHDDKYAAKEHNHDTKYANINHTHNEYQAKGNYQPAGNYAAANHNHDSNYAPLKHEHTEYQAKGDYAPATHTHPEYQPKGNYAPAAHAHPDYAAKNHTHWDLPEDKDDFEEEIKTIVNGPKAWRVIKTIWNVADAAGEVVQYGVVAGQQAEIASIYSALAGAGIIDSAQSASTLGTCLTGYASKLSSASKAFETLGNSVKAIQKPMEAVSKVLKTASNKVSKLGKVVNEVAKCDSLGSMMSTIEYFWKGGKFVSSKLPATASVLKAALI